MSSYGCSTRKMKMEFQGGRSSAYHSMAQPNNIKGRGKGSPLITNIKPQAFRIWVSLFPLESLYFPLIPTL